MNMEIQKKLVMTFKTVADKTVSLSVDNPRDELTESEIKTAMRGDTEIRVKTGSIFHEHIDITGFYTLFLL
ncbi:MAG: DUF2922 domain-containing protein [Fusobacteriaceae bacterium]